MFTTVGDAAGALKTLLERVGNHEGEGHDTRKARWQNERFCRMLAYSELCWRSVAASEALSTR